MATGTATPPPPPTDSPAAPRSTKAQTVIDAQLLRTRRQVKGVDMATAMLTLAVGTLGYLLGVAVLDHWLIPGGLGFWGRLLLLLGLCCGAIALFALRVLPLLVYRINPLFAAHTIEESQPSLKNSVVNFLLLRGHRREMPAVVYQALQQRAARDLAGVPVETVVDRTHAMRLGYALVGVLAACCLYTVISPKSPFISIGRVVWPWADIAAPTRVTIEDVKVGDEVVSRDGVVVSRGDVIAVSAVVRGLDDHEKVTFYYTMEDEQSVNEAIPMEAADGHYYELPPDSFVARQNTEFYLAAGDCKTRVYRIEVQIAPAIALDSVTYDYPKYTGIPDKTVEKQGDLRAVEGTRVTIRATANLKIGDAEIDLDCDRRRGLAMDVDGRSAIRQFPLRMRRDDPLMPEHESYQLRFTDTDGRENRRPARYRIQVIPDLAPRVMLQVQGYDTLPDEIRVPVDESVLFLVAAEDPDFGLQSVALLAEVSAEQEQKKKRLPIAPLFAKPSDDDAPPHRGPLEATYRFEPARLQLEPGDVVIYWAEAKDNKEPAANRQETKLRQMVIVGPGDPGQPKQDPQQPENAQQPNPRNPPPKPREARPDERPQDQDDQTGDEPAQEQPPEEKQPGETEKPAEKPGEKPEPGQQDDSNTQPTQEQQEGPKQGDAEGQQQGDAAEESQRVDPEGNPGEAFEQLLEDQQQQQEKNDAEQKPEQKPDEGAQPKPGDSPSQDDPAGDDSQSKPGDAQQQGDPTSDGAQPKPSDSQQPGDPAGGGSQSKPAGDTQQQGDPTRTDSTSKPGDTPQQGDPAGSDSPSKADDATQPKPGDSREKPSGAAEKGSQPGEKPQQRVPDNDQSGTEGSDPAQQPKPGEGAQSKGHGEPEEPKEKGEPSTAPGDENATGGDSEDSKGEAGAGRPSEESTGTPPPQHNNVARDKQPGEPSQESGTADEAKSPSNSPKDSDSKDGSAGDRSGGGEEGGGQHANQQGTGAAGTHTESDHGANAGSSKGEGETGTEAGDQVEADKRTGKTAPKQGGSGTDSRQKPGAGAGEKPQQQDQANPSGPHERKSDQAGPGRQQGETDQRPNAHGSGNPTSGGQPREEPPHPPAPSKPAQAADDPNLQYAREATDMALEHLRDQLAEENPQVLEKLKWTREDAEKFLRRWEQLKRQAANGDARGAEQAKLNEALQNLGLRPRGAGLGGDRIKADHFRRMREARDFQPPPEWAEQFRAFEMGKSGQ